MKETKQPKNEEKKQSGEVTRRDFLVGAGTVVVGGAIGAGILSGCNGGEGTTKTVEVTKTVEKTTTVGGSGAVTVTETKTVGGDGAVTVTTTKTEGTGGTVPPALEPEETFMAYHYDPISMEVKNGRIIRGRPVHYGETIDITIGGKTATVPEKQLIPVYWMGSRARATSPNRILYPLQRVDWEPGGDPAKINAQNRGKSKYKRISWDEAATIVASEVKRISDTYSPAAIYSCYGSSNPGTVSGQNSCPQAFLDYWGYANYGVTCTHSAGRSTSGEGGAQGGHFVQGSYESWSPSVIQDCALNTELMLIWAGDVELNSWLHSRAGGWIHRFMHEDLGKEYVAILPDFNLGASLFADKWIPVRPQCDGALMLAIAYIWLQEGTYDQAYLDSHSVGFDKFTPYVTGDEDGIPKTPEWAAPLCGIAEWTIKALAHQWAKKNTTIVYAVGGGGLGRGPYGHELTRLQWYLLGMQAWGAPGRHQWHCGNGMTIGKSAKSPVVSSFRADTMITTAMRTATGRRLTDTDTDRQYIPKNWLYKSITEPPVEFYGHEDILTFRTYPLPADMGPGGSEIHMMWIGDPNWSAARGAGFDKMRAHAHEKIDCIVYQHMYMEEQCNMADILLPVSNRLEIRDIGNRGGYEGYEFLMLTKPLVPPAGESKTDFGCVCAVAEKLGFIDEITEGLGYDAVYEKWLKDCYDKCGWTDLVSWEELNEKGYHIEPNDPSQFDDPDNNQARKFYIDPDKSPLSMPTGKLEYESQALKEKPPDDPDRPIVAHWILDQGAKPGYYIDEYPWGEKAKTYPLSVIGGANNWGYHSQHMDIPWDREERFKVAWDGWAYSPLWMHPEDAAARGIQNDDIVKLYNERGGVLFIAVLTEEVMPGALYTQEGGGSDCIVPFEINRGGEINCIPPAMTSRWSMQLCHTGFLAEVEKVTPTQMAEWREQYPDTFKQQSEHYDPAYGMLFSAWVEKEGGA